MLRSNNHSIESTRPASLASVSNRFRIMCRRADGSASLVIILPTLSAAQTVAVASVKKHLLKLKANRETIVRDPLRPRDVYIECWVGSEVHGDWQVVSAEEGGYAFKFLDQAPRLNHGPFANAKQPSASTDLAASAGRSTPDRASVASRDRAASGCIVRCELLTKRTRKNGWFAKIVGDVVSGPITNSSAMPADCQPGQIVSLKVCGIRRETAFASFAWADDHESVDPSRGR